VKLDFVPKTIADGAQTQAVGPIPFGVIKECGNVVDILTVSDDELLNCLTYLANVMKIIVEPTGNVCIISMHDVQNIHYLTTNLYEYPFIRLLGTRRSEVQQLRA